MKLEITLNKIVNWINNVNELLKSLFVFSVIAGLLFNDPFGILTSIGNLLGGLGDKGLSGLLALMLIVLFYNKK